MVETTSNNLPTVSYITQSDVDLPAFAEFSSDAYLHTVTNVTDRDGDGQFDFLYLTGVDDPISYDLEILDIIANTNAHQRGLSQGGANRWACGNASQYGTGEPWAVAWTDYRQILSHYYTGITLKSASGTDLMPPYRWLGLWHDIPPDLELDQPHLVTVIAQNSGATTWYADSIEEQNVALSYQLLGPGGTCRHNCEGLTYHSLPHDVAPGEVITLTPNIYLPSVFPCDLTLRWDMVALPPGSQAQQVNAPTVEFWFSEQWPLWYPLDVPLTECPHHLYLPLIERAEPEQEPDQVSTSGKVQQTCVYKVWREARRL